MLFKGSLIGSILSKPWSIRIPCGQLSSFKYLKMNPEGLKERVCYVKNYPERPTITVSFDYDDETVATRRFNFNRLKEAHLGGTFQRIRASISEIRKKKLDRKRKKSKTQEETMPEGPGDLLEVVLRHKERFLEEGVTNGEAWIDGALLRVGAREYQVVNNAPGVISLKFPKVIMAGFPVYPRIQFEFADLESSEFHWFRNLSKAEANEADPSKLERSQHQIWELLGEGYYFQPDNSCVDHVLRLVCVPKSSASIGEPVEFISNLKVGASPGTCPFEERHLYTPRETVGDEFRCVSYNILAHQYSDSSLAREVLFPYCPNYALQMDYRKLLLLKEIKGYKSDILCLQEVDSSIFINDLEPFLKDCGLDGTFLQKGAGVTEEEGNEEGGGVSEGTAIFYKRIRFRVLESKSFKLSESLKSDPLLEDFRLNLESNEKLRNRVLGRNTCLQLLLLEDLLEPSLKILVANTHLYFHPDADHVRLFQASVCLRVLEVELKKLKDLKVAGVFCGDFNSCPEFGVYRLFTRGRVEADAEDWKSNLEESVVGLSVSHCLSLKSACGTPEYTNFTAGFQGCLDYIFYQDDLLKVTESVPLPSHQTVTQHVAIPSPVIPSDHLALIATLKWKQ